jgi:hypothetical protein
MVLKGKPITKGSTRHIAKDSAIEKRDEPKPQQQPTKPIKPAAEPPSKPTEKK